MTRDHRVHNSPPLGSILNWLTPHIRILLFITNYYNFILPSVNTRKSPKLSIPLIILGVILWRCQYLDVEWRGDRRNGTDFKGCVRGQIGEISTHLPGGDWGKSRRPQVRIAGVPAEIQTEHIPSSSLECYRYARSQHSSLEGFWQKCHMPLWDLRFSWWWILNCGLLWSCSL
jgi:hypothetical protein